MSNQPLPDDFDVIVLGTGLPESILAAACTRIGLNVLHLDRHDFYGGVWASFHLKSLESWTKSVSEGLEEDIPDPVDQQLIPEHHRFVPIQYNSPIRNAGCETLIKDIEGEPPKEDQTVEDVEAEAEESEGHSSEEVDDTPKPSSNVWTAAAIHEQWRKFSLDLTPKICRGRGPLVELMVHSGVGRYAEFKVVDRLLTLIDGKLEQVPCSRSDVFQSNQVTVMEKRKLMKFLAICLNPDKIEDELTKFSTFHDYLQAQDLTPILRHFIENSIAMTPLNTSPAKGMKCMSSFLESVGRFGNSPYLWTMFGSGEIPQCFCRLCAVFGGVYCLNRRVDGYLVDQQNKCTGIISEGQGISCRYIIGDAHYFPHVSTKFSSRVICRVILITDKSVKVDDKEHITLLNIRDPVDANRCVRLLEVSYNGSTCPKGLYTVHLTTAVGCDQEVQNVFQFVYDQFFTGQDQPKILWRAAFSYSLDEPTFDSVPSNILLTHWPDQTIDFETVVSQTRKIFELNWPGEEFLPQIPDQPDVEVMDGTPDPGINGFAPDPILPDTDNKSQNISPDKQTTEDLSCEDSASNIPPPQQCHISQDVPESQDCQES